MVAAVKSLADGDLVGVDEPALAVSALRQLRQQALPVRRPAQQAVAQESAGLHQTLFHSQSPCCCGALAIAPSAGHHAEVRLRLVVDALWWVAGQLTWQAEYCWHHAAVVALAIELCGWRMVQMCLGRPTSQRAAPAATAHRLLVA